MVKRILLIFLFLFMPFISHADTIVIGNDINEKNIPLDMNIMADALNGIFGLGTQKYEFYDSFYTECSVPFSLKDLVDTCRKGFGRTKMTECVDFARMYINKLVEVSGGNIQTSNENCLLKVVSADKGEAIVGAVVTSLQDATKSFVTDVNGKLCMFSDADKAILDGTQLIVNITFTGFKTEQDVQLTYGEEKEVQLERIPDGMINVIEDNTGLLTVREVVERDLEDILSQKGKIGAVAKTHGYYVEQLPRSLNYLVAKSMSDFVNECNLLSGKNGIKKTKVDFAKRDTFKNNTLKEEGILPSLQEHIEFSCVLESCNETTHTRQGDNCVAISGSENTNTALDCVTEVQNEAFIKWSLGNRRTNDINNKYALAVDDDTVIYNKYKTKEKAKLDSLNGETQQYIDGHVFEDGPVTHTLKCEAENLSLKSSNCVGKTIGECDMHFYTCWRDEQQRRNAGRARDEFFKGYSKELVSKICKS